MKRRGQQIVMVTAYDAPGGRIADEAGVDIVLVGDSAAMTVLGHDSTVPVTMDEMLVLTRAVTRGAQPAARRSPTCRSARSRCRTSAAVENAIRFVKEAGADAVKLEGAGPTLSRVARDRRRRDPRDGAHRARRRSRRRCSAASRRRGGRPTRPRELLDDALALEAAGCFAIVLEAVPAPVADADHRGARRSRRSGSAPAPDCDGQVLVWHDLLGLYDGQSPRFVKRYADLATTIRDALAAYAEDVRERRFPEEQHTYAMSDEERAAFASAVGAEEVARTER